MKGMSLRRKFVIIALAIIMAMISVYSSSPSKNSVNAQVITDDGLIFDNGVITGYIGNKSTITIPATIDGKEVKSINSAFYENEDIVYVTVSDGITAIQGLAFQSCPNLKTIVIPKSVTSIEPGSLAMCPKLEGIALSSDNLNYTIEGDILYDKDQSSIIQYISTGTATAFTIPESVFVVHTLAFACASNLQDLVIPETTKVIGDGAFAACPKLKTITVADGNEEYKTYDNVLFSKDGEALVTYPADKAGTSYTIPNGATIAAPYCFTGCNYLKTVELCSSITHAPMAFVENYVLESINVNGSNTTFSSDNGVLYSNDMTSLIFYPCGKKDKNYTVHSSTKTIKANSFLKQQYIEGINLQGGAETIENMAINKCETLEKIFIPQSVETFKLFSIHKCPNIRIWGYRGSEAEHYAEICSIPFWAVGIAADWDYIDNGNGTCNIKKYKGSAKEVIVPSVIKGLSVDTVKFTAFNGLSDIESITFYPSTRVLESCNTAGTMHVFQGCTSLKEIYFPETLETIESYTTDYKPFQGCSSLENINIDGDNTHFYQKDGVLFSSDNILLKYPDGKAWDQYSIPEGTEGIKASAFDGKALKEVTVPSSVFTLSQGFEPMFKNNIKTVYLSEGVETVEDIFSHTSAIDVYFPESVYAISGFDYENVPHTFYVYDKSTPHYYAIAKKIKHVLIYYVTFDSNGGSDVPQQTVISGKNVVRPTNVTKDNYVVKGWYSDEALTKEWDFSKNTVTKSMTLYAKWTEGYPITYNLNGGTNNPDNPTYYVAGDEIDMKDPSKKGFSFSGWFTDPTCNQNYYFDGISRETRGPIELWAAWWIIPDPDDDNDDDGGGGGNGGGSGGSTPKTPEVTRKDFPEAISYIQKGQKVTVSGKLYFKNANVNEISALYPGNSEKIYLYKEGDKRLDSFTYSHTFEVGDINYNSTDNYIISVRIDTNDTFQHVIPITKYSMRTEALNAPNNTVYISSKKTHQLSSMAITNDSYQVLSAKYENLTPDVCKLGDNNTFIPLKAGTAKIKTTVTMKSGEKYEYVSEFIVAGANKVEPSKEELELMCQCCGEYCTGFPEDGIDPALIELIKQIREEAGVPVYILSGYKCPQHNRNTGGDKNSEHLNGKAADLWVVDITLDELYEICDKLNVNGSVGKYDDYIHIDTRGTNLRWEDQ